MSTISKVSNPSIDNMDTISDNLSLAAASFIDEINFEESTIGGSEVGNDSISQMVDSRKDERIEELEKKVSKMKEIMRKA